MNAEAEVRTAEGELFGAHGRYTHVHEQAPDRWRLVAAQGTPIQS